MLTIGEQRVGLRLNHSTTVASQLLLDWDRLGAGEVIALYVDCFIVQSIQEDGIWASILLVVLACLFVARCSFSRTANTLGSGGWMEASVSFFCGSTSTLLLVDILST